MHQLTVASDIASGDHPLATIAANHATDSACTYQYNGGSEKYMNATFAVQKDDVGNFKLTVATPDAWVKSAGSFANEYTCFGDPASKGCGLTMEEG